MEKTTVRRSVALPRALVEEALSAAPARLKGNLNSLVKEALREYISNRRASEFETAMATMAMDPEILDASDKVQTELRCAEMDGL